MEKPAKGYGRRSTNRRDGTTFGIFHYYASIKSVFNPVTLSFAGAHKSIEAEFLAFYRKNALPQVRFSILLGIFLFSAFGILDAALIPEAKKAIWTIRYAIVCPVGLIVFLITYSAYYDRLMQASLCTMLLTGGLGIVAMIVLAPPPASLSYYTGVILVFLYGYTFIRLRFIWATLTCWGIVLGYEISWLLIKPAPTAEVINNNFFFLGANIIGMFACYSIEYYTRRDFFMACQLGQEQEKVSAINLQLEERVKQRTEQLVKTNQDLKNEMETSRQAEQEKLALQLQLQQAQKMEAVGTLAGGIAHDFNNILAAIMGHTEISLMQVEKDELVRESLDKILQASLRAKELVNQILTFSRQNPLNVQRIMLKPIIREVIGLLRASLPRTIDITDRISKDLYAIEADPTQIHQVLMNLCTNAAHAMEENGGLLTVELENINLSKEKHPPLWDLQPGKYVKLSVADTGHGIAPENLGRIFDPYFTTKKPGKGTGMGLSVSHGIIKSYNGAITVKSERGSGTRFDLYFPGYEREEGKTAEVLETLPGGKERILFVDDEETLVEMMKNILKRLGYRVVATDTPLDALELFRTDPMSFDLVITDMAMPRMTGDQFARELLKIRKEIPIIMCTGFNERVNTSNIASLGIRRLLMKPLSISNISSIIREVLDTPYQVSGIDDRNSRP
jgi:signal transduction histidine kinase/ActR/RegA family two-component response regulator